MKVYVDPSGAYEIRGNHSETKPVNVVPHGSVFWEQDTNKKYFYDEDTESWSEIGFAAAAPAPVLPVQITVNIPSVKGQTNSTATTVECLKDDFNALLAKLIEAGLMAEPVKPESASNPGMDD